MLSSDRRTFLILAAALPLSACGFAPAYGPGGQATGLLDRVTVDAPENKDDFDLVERLEERLGRPAAAAFRLSYRVEVEVEGQAIAQDNRINRYQVIGKVAYTLHDAGTDEALSSGKVSSFTAYSAFGTSVAAAASESDARTRLMRILADRIVTQLIATSAEWNRP
ncbi:LPS assembly lipoprotein LptE [Defluviimonas sp. WL0050]|uniref:LPS assembly lipoprotein LptE n=1 Tax=Albidovulum litorale TaxID=2984134 RepID=A0ABT2ZRG2_9RHOB|nr:LPS assembly lipoprotein LptE [Defluviimonas sp. WL0050]MCV2873750.1 LPS assembly lipoprotein LptE [Defluviimonas sp. WL0050]